MDIKRLRRAIGAPVHLRWHERHRRRFLHEYHEMKARAGAELFWLGDQLVWAGKIQIEDVVIEWVIQYHRAHPAIGPTVRILSPTHVMKALNADSNGRVRVYSQGSWHAGLTALDAWHWLRQMLRAF